MGPLVYFNLCLLGCLLFNPTAEGVRNRTLARPRSPCPPGVLYYNKACYEYLNDRMKWQDAEDSCQYWRNGHLASILSAPEENIISKYIRSPSSPSRVWIGLKATSKKAWKWSDGSQYMPTSALWDGRIPSLKPSSDQCISLINVNKPEEDERWKEVVCSGKHPYLCKYPSAY